MHNQQLKHVTVIKIIIEYSHPLFKLNIRLGFASSITLFQLNLITFSMRTKTQQKNSIFKIKKKT